MNKNAVSPIVSTVILIVFATVLGAIVMSWSDQLPTDIDVRCDSASIEIVEMQSNFEICQSENTLRFTLANGELRLSGIRISIIGDNSIQNVDIEQNIGIGETKRFSVIYDVLSIGDIQKIFIMPFTKTSGKVQICPRQKVSLENIRSC